VVLAGRTKRSSRQYLARLAEDNAFVPALWHFEVRNLIVMAERRARLTSAMAAESLSLIAECPVTLIMTRT
jgi:hypothetical protein